MQLSYTGDSQLVQQLFFDTQVTASLEDFWNDQQTDANILLRDGIEATFVATSGGLTRVYPAHMNDTMQAYKDVWNAVYFKRAFDNEIWIFSGEYHKGWCLFLACQFVS